MICNRCLEDKDKMEFQTDNSYYCNSCIKLFGQPNLMEASGKSKSNQQANVQYNFVQLDNDVKEIIVQS
jgi:late competence protein required for DNA uptake (superfamily II DNA/RNA helicase)